MKKWFRRKVAAIAEQQNTIGAEVVVGAGAYVSGSNLSGHLVVGDKCKIYQAHVEGDVAIGRYTSLWGPGIHVVGRVNGVSIGSFCSIGRYVSIQEDYHDIARTTTYFVEGNLFDGMSAADSYVSKGKVVIGSDVWIGANAHILSGVTVGTGSVVAAASVVTKDVPPYAVVAGNPAVLVRYRFSPAVIAELLKSEWWNWSTERLLREKAFLLRSHSPGESV